MNNLISICIATYNGEKYLKEQLNSIVNQTYSNLEIIAQDDCSTDNTLQILEEYAKKYNIKIYKNKTNLGYIKNFENVLKKVNGEFIAICDQDDIWELDKIELLMNNIKDSSLIYSNSLLIGENGNSLDKTLLDKLKNNFIDSSTPINFIFDNCISAHAMLFKKELLNTIFPLPTHIYFDAWIAANAANLKGVKYFDKCLVQYRQHSANTLSKHNLTNKDNSSKIIKKINTKADKKFSNVKSKILILEEFLKMKNLKSNDKDIINSMIVEYKKFNSVFINFSLFKILQENKEDLYTITNKNIFLLTLKQSFGYKLYKILPIL